MLKILQIMLKMVHLQSLSKPLIMLKIKYLLKIFRTI